MRQAVLTLLFQRDDLHRDVPRGRIELELIEHRPAQHVRQEDVQRDGSRDGTGAPATSPIAPLVATMPLKPRSRASPSRMRAKCGSSSMIRKTASSSSMSLRSSSMCSSRAIGQDGDVAGTSAPMSIGRRCRRSPRTCVVDRQVQREGAALRRSTLASRISPPSSSASSRLMARPRPVPPYLREVPASACWKASKISRCLSGAMPMPVSSTAKATTCGDLLSTGWSGLQPPDASADAHVHVAVGGELDRVGKQVLEHLLQALGIARAWSAAGRRRSRTLNGRFFGLGDVAEVAFDVVAQVGEGDGLDFDRDRARLDLRQVEDVVDQMQQVGARRVDVAARTPPAWASGCRPHSRPAAG